MLGLFFVAYINTHKYIIFKYIFYNLKILTWISFAKHCYDIYIYHNAILVSLVIILYILYD